MEGRLTFVHSRQQLDVAAAQHTVRVLQEARPTAYYSALLLCTVLPHIQGGLHASRADAAA
jgi:hypothetical protein